MGRLRIFPLVALAASFTSVFASACSKDAPPAAPDPCEDLVRCCEAIGGPTASQCRAAADAARGGADAAEACKAALTTMDRAGTCRSDGVDGGADSDAPSARAICDAYIACVGKTTPEGLGAVAAAYGPSGACWSAADESVCIEACRTGVRGVRKLFPDEEACHECVGPADCSDSSAAGRVCDAPSGRCVACTSDRDCGGTTPACDPRKHACVGCTAKEHCKTGACDRASATCVACVSDADCAAPNPRCKKESGVAPACVACRAPADCASGACDPDGKCCQPESCGQHKQLLGIRPETWLCGTVDSARCSSAKIDCGTCARGTCAPFMGGEGRCSLEDTPCTPGVAGTCQNDELCAYVPAKSGYVCSYNLRGTTCVYGGDSYKCGNYHFTCEGANMVQDGVCRSYCLAQTDCAAGEICRFYPELGYGTCR